MKVTVKKAPPKSPFSVIIETFLDPDEALVLYRDQTLGEKAKEATVDALEEHLRTKYQVSRTVRLALDETP